MCGISGIVGLDHAIAPFVEFQEHRGPDSGGFGIYRSGEIKFGHNRLSIIDLSEQGGQPMTYEEYEITFNGEIYNYKELKQHLINTDGLGDTATFLRYIYANGLKVALKDAIGMWAFGLFDRKQNQIHLVVDRLGEKPLYYYLDDKVFAFASSPAALLHLKQRWKINRKALASYWKLGAVMHDSIWEGIVRVNAAEQVTFDIGTRKITTDVYWRPQYKPNADLRELVYEAIDAVRVADVPVYLFLSGGIDSSVCASRKVFDNAIHMMGPEYEHAKRVADKFGINLISIEPKESDAVVDMTDYVKKCGEPSMSALIPYITSREAAKYCKVAVSANGADELFFGYNRTTERVTPEQWDHIFREDLSKNRDIEIDQIDSKMSTGRWFELKTYVEHDLNKTLDFASMAHSLEVRSPFLNHKLVEAALSTPLDVIGRKKLLKDILREFGFDDRFLNRPKLGFTLYREPRNHNVLQAFHWCVMHGWLPRHAWGARDFLYLKAAAFSFKIWYETFKNIIEK